MLRIAINDTASEQRWVLQGRLAGPWIRELRWSWEKARDARQGRKCVVDLTDVTFIDELGQEVLRAMMRAGAQFIACGVCTRYVLEKIDRALHSSERRAADDFDSGRDCVEWGQPTQKK